MIKKLLNEIKIFFIWETVFFLLFLIFVIASEVISGGTVKHAILSYINSFNIIKEFDYISYLIITIPYLIHTLIRLLVYLLIKQNIINQVKIRIPYLSILIIIFILIFYICYYHYYGHVVESYFSKVCNYYVPLSVSLLPDSTNYSKITWKRIYDIDHDHIFIEVLKFQNDTTVIINQQISKSKIDFWFPIKHLFGIVQFKEWSEHTLKYKNRKMFKYLSTDSSYYFRKDSLFIKDGKLFVEDKIFQ